MKGLNIFCSAEYNALLINPKKGCLVRNTRKEKKAIATKTKRKNIKITEEMREKDMI